MICHLQTKINWNNERLNAGIDIETFLLAGLVLLQTFFNNTRGRIQAQQSAI